MSDNEDVIDRLENENKTQQDEEESSDEEYTLELKKSRKVTMKMKTKKIVERKKRIGGKQHLRKYLQDLTKTTPALSTLRNLEICCRI